MAGWPMARTLRLGVISTYPPREDGIATYTRDMLRGIGAQARITDTRVAAITKPGTYHSYPPEVCLTITQGQTASYAEAVRALAEGGAQVLLVEHEFGLYGGLDPFVDLTPALLDAASGVGLPLVATLHTVQPRPSAPMRESVRRLCARSAAVTVMASASADLLRTVYGVDPARIEVIPHGIHEECAGGQKDAKARLGIEGRRALCTFGLIHRNKGIDVALQALPEVVARFPDVVYVIAGETHPEVRQRKGEAYRHELMAQVERLHLREHVRFINHYLTLNEVFDVLRAADVYLLPYRDLTQASSGTLAYALGCGRAAVSTPFVYAQEALAEGRGLLIEPGNAKTLARAVLRVLDDAALRQSMQARARVYGRAMTWPRVGALCAAVLRRAAGAGTESELAVSGRGG